MFEPYLVFILVVINVSGQNFNYDYNDFVKGEKISKRKSKEYEVYF